MITIKDLEFRSEEHKAIFKDNIFRQEHYNLREFLHVSLYYYRKSDGQFIKEDYEFASQDEMLCWLQANPLRDWPDVDGTVRMEACWDSEWLDLKSGWENVDLTPLLKKQAEWRGSQYNYIMGSLTEACLARYTHEVVTHVKIEWRFE